MQYRAHTFTYTHTQQEIADAVEYRHMSTSTHTAKCVCRQLRINMSASKTMQNRGYANINTYIHAVAHNK